MIATSADFQANVLNPARRWKSRVTVNFTDVFLDQSISAEVLDANINRGAYIDQLANGRSGATKRWFMLGQSQLNGQSSPGPSTAEANFNEIGWWGEDLSDGTGDFTTAQRVKINFAPRPVAGFSLAADDKWGEYPVDYTVEFFDGVTSLGTFTKTGNTEIFAREATDAYTDVDSVILSITKWSKANTVAKLTEFSTEVIQVFEDEDVVNWTLSEQRDLSNQNTIPFGNITSSELNLELVNQKIQFSTGRDPVPIGFVVDENDDKIDDGYGDFIFAIPAEQVPEYGFLTDETNAQVVDGNGDPIFLTIVNSSRVFDIGNSSSFYNGRLRPNNRVQVELGLRLPDGTYEFLPMGTGWTNDWNVPAGGVSVSTSARDRLELLAKTRTEGTDVIVNETFAYLFELVLNDAGLSSSEYEIDPELDTALYNLPYSWVDQGTHRSRLEQLAQGCGATVFADRNGKIIIRGVDYDARNAGTVNEIYTQKDYSTKQVPVIYSKVSNSITVTTSPLVQVTGQTVYTSTEDEEIGASATETFTIFYTDKPVSGASASIDPPVAGVSISNAIYYSWGASLEVTNANGTAQNFKFLVTGTTYEVQGQTQVTAKDQDNIAEFGEQAFTVPENPFLQKRALAQKIADTLLATYSRTDKDATLTFEPGGNPSLELGDTMQAVDKYASTNYYIVENEYRYNGGLSTKHRGRVV